MTAFNSVLTRDGSLQDLIKILQAREMVASELMAPNLSFVLFACERVKRLSESGRKKSGRNGT